MEKTPLLQLSPTLHFHRWQYSTKGRFYAGFMYPACHRTCKICGLQQVEVMAQATKEVHWQVVAASELVK